MSLEEEIKSNKVITFLLKDSEDSKIKFTYPYQKFITLQKCEYCSNINKYLIPEEIDLSQFYYENFILLLKYMETG